jgi:hypothetical protein
MRFVFAQDFRSSICDKDSLNSILVLLAVRRRGSFLTFWRNSLIRATLLGAMLRWQQRDLVPSRVSILSRGTDVRRTLYRGYQATLSFSFPIV